MNMTDQLAVRLYPDLYSGPDPDDPDAVAQLAEHAITVNPITEAVILIRFTDDGTGEMSVEIDGSPFDNPEQLAGVLLGFAQMIATGETVGVQVPNFPPEPEEQP